MSALNASQLLDLIREATRGANRKVIESHPGLAWLLPDLDAHATALAEALGGDAEDSTLDELRATARARDLEHDEAHRFLFALLQAGLLTGTAAQRAAVEQARTVLYPDGLRVVQQAYRDEVANTTAFAKRLAREDVKAGLEALGAFVKRVRNVAQACVKAGEALGDVLRKLDAAEVAAKTAISERVLFMARTAAMSTWSVFVANVEHVLVGDAPEVARQREGLLHRWRAFITKTPTRSTTPDPSPSTEGAGTPSPSDV